MARKLIAKRKARAQAAKAKSSTGGFYEDTTELSDQQKADQTMERLKASAKWWHDTFWEEFQDAFRSYEVRRKMLTYPQGHPRGGQEDKTRTNIALPEMFIGIRRKAVRKTRRPPSIKVHSKNPMVAELLSHMATYQWDKANEQKFQWRHVMQGDLFGISLKEHTYDDVNQQRTVRRSIDQILDQLYVKIEETDKERNYFIVPPDDLQARRGSDVIRADQMDEDMKADFMAQQGPEMAFPQDFSRFSGPVSSWIFVGDWYPEPEFDQVQGSAWHIFEGIRDAEWIAYMASKEYTDPRDGKRKPVFDPKKLDDLEEYRPLNAINEKSRATGAERDFRQTLRDVIFKARPMYEARLVPGRRYLIHKEYTFRKGHCWVRFVGNEKILLGEMPIPWDLGGRYPISAYTPMPSLLWGVGDSTARKGRHLWELHNITVSQRTDLITNALKKLIVLPKQADIPNEVMDLGTLRVMFSDNYREIIAALQAPGITIPADAWQQEAAILRALQQLEPSMIDFGEQSQAEPNSSKVATLGMLQQRAADAISADELEQLNNSISEETDIKLSMWQQVLTGQDMSELTDPKNDSFWTILGGGGMEHPRKQHNDPLELQEDFEVFPEMGSTLALDDIMRKQQAQELYDRAIGAPQIWDVMEAARRLAMCSGVAEPEKLLAPPMPPPPPPKPKASVTLALKGEATPEMVAAIVQEGYEIPVHPDEVAESQLHHRLKEAAASAKDAKYLAGGEEEEAPEEKPIQ